MGGVGSGRHWQLGSETTDVYRSIDVRWLKREGLLSLGGSRSISWSHGGEVTGSINIRSETGRVILNYHHRDRGGDWQNESYPVQIDTTPCQMGGARHWFRCPARGCARRVAILYGGAIFACRYCHHLAYPSQRETPRDRAVRRADRISDRMGWPGGVLDSGERRKPKGMHWRTYHQRCAEHDALSDYVLVEMMDYLNRLTEPF